MKASDQRYRVVLTEADGAKDLKIILHELYRKLNPGSIQSYPSPRPFPDEKKPDPYNKL